MDTGQPIRSNHRVSDNRVSDPVEAYLATIDPAHRPLYDRVERLIERVAPNAQVSISYGIPTFRNGRRRLYVGVWRHGVSLYGWKADGDGGFSARHPGLLHGRGTIRLRGGDEVTDNELRELIHATLVL